jgi:hypothetical protein
MKAQSMKHLIMQFRATSSYFEVSEIQSVP